MAKAKHTPGPWATDEYEHDQPYLPIKIRAGKHHTICTIPIDDAPVPDFNAKQEANARLIVAAPDLLAALEATRIVLAEHEPHPLPVLAQVLAAIVKAKGKT